MKLYCDPISTTTRPVLLFRRREPTCELERVQCGPDEQREPGARLSGDQPQRGRALPGQTARAPSARAAEILRYLADQIGSPAYPNDLKARPGVDEALGWFSTNLHEYFCLFAIYPKFGIPHRIDPTLAQAMIHLWRRTRTQVAPGA